VIDPANIGAIIDLERTAGALGVPLMMIGAGARLLLLDWKLNLPTRRTTKDWDFGVRMGSSKQFERLRDELTRPGATFRATGIEHRFVHTSGTLVDLVPFGEIEKPEAKIQWPGSHAVMTVVGFRDADAHATRVELAPGIHVRVVSIATLVILKLVAYQDRNKADDLADVLFILEYYSRYELDARILDELAEQLAGGKLPFEYAGAYLLGRDMAAQCSPSNRLKLGDILDDLLRERDALARLVPRT
jgi:predicted nucleotidyltransferase